MTKNNVKFGNWFVKSINEKEVNGTTLYSAEVRQEVIGGYSGVHATSEDTLTLRSLKGKKWDTERVGFVNITKEQSLKGVEFITELIEAKVKEHGELRIVQKWANDPFVIQHKDYRVVLNNIMIEEHGFGSEDYLEAYDALERRMEDKYQHSNYVDGVLVPAPGEYSLQSIEFGVNAKDVDYRSTAKNTAIVDEKVLAEKA